MPTVTIEYPKKSGVIGKISANGETVSSRVEGFSSVILSMIATSLSGHSSIFEVSDDASVDPETGEWDGSSGTWYQTRGQRSNTATIETGETTLASTPAYYRIIDVSSWKFFRVRATAHTSGAMTYRISHLATSVPTVANMGTQTLASSTSIIGDVVGGTRTTTGGLASIARLVSAAASTNATSAKASAGRVYKVYGYNASTSVRYLKLYNKASAPTVGTDTPVATIPLKPSDVFNIDFGLIGQYFSTGIGYALTTGSADSDTGALTAADVVGLNIYYA
jgi:hypothetical protein